MYHYLLGITFLKSWTPYYRKYILDVLESHELLFLNTLCISILVLIYFLYKCLCHNSFNKTIENYKNLTSGHYFCILVIALFTVSSSLFLYDLDKYHNTPFLNSLFIKIASVFVLFLVGIFIFEEKYSIKQIIGIILTMIGIYLVTSKEKKGK
jgi:drug/metabolite transporter (DMT)-like permease